MEENITNIQENITNILPEIQTVIENHIVFDNEKNIEFFGTDEQRASMFNDWALYFGEITNPENTTVNKIFGGAKYSPLNEVLNVVRPIMSKFGLAIIQSPFMDTDGNVCLKTLVVHKGGAAMSFPLAKTKLVRPNNAVTEIQAFGSMSTYLRRFSVNAVAGVAGEIDDDGNIGKDTKTPPPEVKDLKPLQQEIVDLITKYGGSTNEEVMTVVKEFIASGNPFKIKDENKLNELKTKLQSYKGEDK